MPIFNTPNLADVCTSAGNNGIEHLSVTAFAQGFTSFHVVCLIIPVNNGTNKHIFRLALTQANATVQIVHERPAEAGGCFLDLSSLSLKNDVVSSSMIREGIFHLYVRKEEGRMSRKGASSCRALKARMINLNLKHWMTEGSSKKGRHGLSKKMGDACSAWPRLE